MLKTKNGKKQYMMYCFLLLLLLIPNYATALYSSDMETSFVLKMSYLLFAISIWLLPLIVLKPKVYFSICFIFLLLSPIEISFVKSVGQPINSGLMESILYTNYREASEQIRGHLGLILIFITIAVVYILVLKKLFNIKLQQKFKFEILTLFVLCNVAIFFKIHKVAKASGIHGKEAINYAIDNTYKKYSKIFPSNVFIGFYDAINYYLENKNFDEKIKNYAFEAQLNPEKKDAKQIFVLVLGETARNANFGLYGYHRATTPNLEKEKNLIAFDNMYSSATLTAQSIPQIITRATPDHFKIQYNEKTMVDAFKEAGFYTAWIGNQDMPLPVTKRLAKAVDYYYTSKSEVNATDKYDIEANTLLNKIIKASKKDKILIVIHSLGSHFRYSNRYPDPFEKFRPTISKKGYDNITYEYKQALINSYDNSILYTDYFLSTIIKTLERQKNTESSMLYLSDHGENLYDDDKKMIFHGTLHPPRYEYHIPYLIWTSNTYNQNNPNIVEHLKMNASKKASSTSTFSTFINMADITYRNSEKEQKNNLASDKYLEPKVRKILTGSGKVISVD